MNTQSSQPMISRLWLQVAILTFLSGFAVLGYLAYRITAQQPPMPARVAVSQYWPSAHEQS